MIRATSSYIIADLMHHIHDFLSARDLLALSWTSRNNRMVLMCSGWEAAIRARFPYKRAEHPSSPGYVLRFLLNLESRVADAPPHGRARRFLASFEPREKWNHILCDEHIFKSHQSGTLYVPRADIIIRGDILIDERARMFIYDGYRCHHVPCRDDVYQSLAVVFNIPFEFDITYYERGFWRGCNIGFRIDARVKYEKMSDAMITFAHDGKTYIIDMSALGITGANFDKFQYYVLCLTEQRRFVTRPDFYTQPRDCTTYRLKLFV